jgi:hypothetical protein
VGAATLIATANPAGLIISTGMKAYGEMIGKSKVEGRVFNRTVTITLEYMSVE